MGSRRTARDAARSSADPLRASKPLSGSYFRQMPCALLMLALAFTGHRHGLKNHFA
jgi:hypothetical protein